MRFSPGAVLFYCLVPLVSSFPANQNTSLVAGRNSTNPGYDCVPHHPCWPNRAQWQKLNSTVGGNLHATVPFEASCYPGNKNYDPEQCKSVQVGYANSTVRSSVYGASQVLNWQSCGNVGCTLQSTQPELQPFFKTCSPGRLASYYVDARTANDVSRAVRFARKHNLRLSIKNTGHDYFGRHVAPNSLAIWTHNMNDMAYHPHFVAHKCPPANAENIGEIGAGVQAAAAYEYFGKHHMGIPGGNDGTVGLAGGYGQGGGHGIYAPSRGLMVDNAVEFDVVTADGKRRTINQCNDPDLFWAMRGGGGGTYAVLTSYKFRVFPEVPINTYTIQANFTNPNTLRDILTAHANNQTTWSSHNVSGNVYYYPNRAEFYFIHPYNDNGSLLKKVTSDFRNYVTKYPGIKIGVNKPVTYPSYRDYIPAVDQLVSKLAPVGVYEVPASRLIPKTLFAPQNVSSLVDAVISGLNQNKKIKTLEVAAQVLMTTPVHHPDVKRMTGVNPAWRDALWHLDFAGGWTTNISISDRRSITQTVLKSLDPLKELTPGGGCYMNEASYLEPDWQRAFFGSNYDRLLSIKRRYDPSHLFDCYKCVGWRGPSE